MGHMTYLMFFSALLELKMWKQQKYHLNLFGEISSMCDVTKNKMALKKKKVWQDFTLRWKTDL